MNATLFPELCRQLGYDPASVLSLRVNRRRAVVVFTDPSGALCHAVHAQVEETPRVSVTVREG
ncbi:hypothetical protein [Geodermatophilus sp. URMC 64]